MLGGYADTWFVELAQNAADAGATRLRVTAASSSGAGELRVANDGAPLTASGVAALASLRASAKRDDDGSVGRFGVGFAAVLAISAEPRIASTGGGVAFSAVRTRAEIAELPVAAAELARRAGPPVLRLVWPLDDPPPAGFGTEVRLPLRPGTDAATLVDQARAAAPDLLLALPGLAEIDVGGDVLRRAEDGDHVTVGDRHWRLARAAGLLAGTDRDRAAEQRDRARWTVTWALPVDAGGAPVPLGDDVAHAPTATTEGLSLPARLIATLPLEPDRRRVRPGAATDVVLAGAVAAYLELVAATAPADRLALVPGSGFPRSPLDGRLRELLLAGLRSATWLPAPGGELAPGRAEWLDLPGAAPRLIELLAAAGLDRFALPVVDPVALTELGVRRVGSAELVERLFGPDLPVSWWAQLYTELAGPAESVPGLVDELRALPVPLAGGRTAAGPATVLLPGSDPLVDAVAELGLPGLHVAALTHPLLTRLGAAPAEPAALLRHPALTEAVERSLEDAEAGLDPRPLAEAVLALVERVGAAPDACRALALPDDAGRPARADELMLPDAAVAPLLAADVPVDTVDPALAARVSRAALVAVGVLDGFTVVLDEEPTGPDHDLDGEDDWWDTAGEPPGRMLAVRDLDLVADDVWPAALALLGGERDTRAAVLVPGGHTGWWLARHARLGGETPQHWRLPSATTIAGLYDPVPAVVDDELLVAIGVRGGLAVTDRCAADDLLDRLVDPARSPDAVLTAAAHAALAEAVAAGLVAAADLVLPDRVRALDGSVTDVEVAVVLDAPWPAAVLPAAELVIGGDPEALAELLDLPLATEVVAGTVDSAGTPIPWRALPEIVVACDVLGVEVPDGTVVVHDELWVALTRPEHSRVRVPVWRQAGKWHAEDPLRALVSALAR